MQLRMRSSSLGLIALAALAITPVWGDVVTYSTTGTFTSTTTNVLTGANGLTITYNNTSSNVVAPVPPPSLAQFGSFTVVGPATGSDTVSDNFTLTIAQTTPSVGGETLTDIFSGSISISSSSVVLQFTGGSGDSVPVLSVNPFTFAPAYTFMLGNAKYWINQYTQINPSTTGAGGPSPGESTISGAITSTVPDGGMTLMLLGGALVGVEGLRRKLRV